jgi:hypothetical protein
MINHAKTSIECFARFFVMLVPRGERSDNPTGISRIHRRVCSKVSRTTSAVSMGSADSGAATKSFPRFRKVIGVARSERKSGAYDETPKLLD